MLVDISSHGNILGVALLFGIWQRIVAWCSAGLLLSFALTMSVALGVVAPLSYSVFTAFGGAFLLGAIAARRVEVFPPQTRRAERKIPARLVSCRCADI
jgi:hypothetical protein